VSHLDKAEFDSLCRAFRDLLGRAMREDQGIHWIKSPGRAAAVLLIIRDDAMAVAEVAVDLLDAFGVVTKCPNPNVGGTTPVEEDADGTPSPN